MKKATTKKATTECTLLDLLQGINDVTDDEREVLATVTYLVNSGRVRLKGNFAGAKIALPPSLSMFPERMRPTLLGLPAYMHRQQAPFMKAA